MEITKYTEGNQNNKKLQKNSSNWYAAIFLMNNIYMIHLIIYFYQILFFHMLEFIITIMMLFVLAFFPVLIWGYIFSYIEWNSLSRKRFTFGLCWGAISVVPILFLDKLLESPWFSFLNIFSYITQINSLSSLLQFSASLGAFLFILAGVAFMAVSWSHKNKTIFTVYLKNIGLFIGFIWLMSLLIYIFALSGIGYWEVAESVSFGETIFNTLKLIIFYYILVAFIEEASKHFNFLQGSVLGISSVEQWVLYAIFVALGFALIENMLYLYTGYTQSGITYTLASTYFYRSIFSIMLHVMCSAIVGYAFSKAYIESSKQFFSPHYMKIFFTGLFIWIFLHVIFDVALTLGFSFVIILYFIVWYLYISSIFYKE